MEIIITKTEKIKLYEKNPKSHPKSQILKLAKQIKKFGFDQPIVLDKNLVVIKGHGRLLAARELGLETVPTVIRDDLKQLDIKKIRIADNQLAKTEWENDFLNDELEDIFKLEPTEELDTLGVDVLDDFGILDGNSKKPLEEIETKPVNKIHVLFSFSPDLLIQLNEKFSEIYNIEGVEYETTAN